MINISRTNSTDNDFKLLIDLLDNELREVYGQMQDTYDKFNKVEFCDTVIIGLLDNVPIGCGCFVKYSDDTVEIKRMYVSKQYRGQGLSKDILQGLQD